jgi:NADPH:quinone reductase-like Zn-dependent oxidoreductase
MPGVIAIHQRVAIGSVIEDLVLAVACSTNDDLVCTRYGPPEVLTIRKLAKPLPRAGEIRVRLGATTVTAACGMMRRGDTLMARVVLGLFGPRKRFQVAGIEFAGTVDDVGRSVDTFRPGNSAVVIIFRKTKSEKAVSPSVGSYNPDHGSAPRKASLSRLRGRATL